AMPLPFDEPVAAATPEPLRAIVGAIESAVDAAGGKDQGERGGGSESVLTVAVTRREAEAARALLAREEGQLVSLQGAGGLAGLARALRDDRARKPRERRIVRGRHVVMVLTGDPVGVGPARAADRVPRRPVTLAELLASPERLLVEPPGRAGGQ